jgi:uncharacterized membrane protein
MARKKAAIPSRSRAHIHESVTLGDRVADKIAAGVGSWRFIIISNALVLLWVLINFTVVLLRWDPYPFILLNLVFSWQAFNTGPILQKTQNRQAERDRKRDDHEAQEVEELFKIQLEQVKILNQQSEILELLKAQKGKTAA